MGKKSRNKGSGYERKIAKILGHWWADDPELFRRTPMSGGWAKEKLTGDITPVKEEGEDFPFSVECKKHEGWEFHQFFSIKSKFWDWWEQCVSDCEGKDKLPLLIFSRNRIPDFMACSLIPNETFKFPEFYFKLPDMYLNNIGEPKNHSIYIMKLQEFIDVNK